ncbi:MAG: hypothetical protein KGQ93_00020 [Cyanobacteria bacterium REEB459]|nr:hypothetical protein [Cyanobacteria bacterium REEB459]
MAEDPNPTPDQPKKKVIETPRRLSGDQPRNQERRGRGKPGREEERKPAIPPALMRGPRPKPKAEPEEALEPVAEPGVEPETKLEAGDIAGDEDQADSPGSAADSAPEE